MRGSVACLVLATAAAVATPSVTSAAEQLTLDDVAGQALKEAMSTPEYAWLDDGSALLFDKRRPPGERVLERFDPEQVTRSPAVDRGKALASLSLLMDGQEEKPPETVGWPTAVHPAGRLALYEIDGDLYLLYLRGSSFRRLTSSAQEETCPSFSPDGTAVAFVRDGDLYLVDLAREGEQRLTGDGSVTLRNGTASWVYWEEIFGREDHAYWWSPDSQAIAYLQSDDAGVAESLTLGYEPATPAVVRQRYPKAGSPNPAVRLGVVGRETGATTWARLGDPAPEYLVRVRWLPDSRSLAVQTLDRAQQRLELRLVNPADGSSGLILTETSPTWVSPVDDLRFLGRGARFLWSSEREGFARLYLYRSDGTLERPLSPTTVVLRPSNGVADADGSVVAVDEAGGWVYYTACEGSPVAPALYRCRLDASANQRLSREPGTHRVGFDRQAQRYLDRHATLSTPPRLSLYRADGAPLAVVTPPATDVLERFAVQTPRLVTYPADDGLELPAQLLKPRDFDPGRRYPVLVSVYGGPSAPTVRDDWDRDTLLDNLFLDAGIVCVAADPRSATAHDKTSAETSYRRLFAAREVQDLSSFVRWLKAQPWVDPERVGVWGWSGGGTFTLHLMTRTKEFRAGVAVAAVTDLRYYDTVWTEALLGPPDANPDGYQAASPATTAGALSGRLLLVHGLADDNVHVQNAWRYARELVDAGITFDMMIYPKEAHSITGARKHLYQTMLEFWKRWL